MGTSWINFYNELTAGAQAASQLRAQTRPYPNLTYATLSGQAKELTKKQSPKTDLDRLGIFKYLGGAGFIDDVLNKPEDTATPGARILDVLSRGTYASANFTSEMNRKYGSEGISAPIEPLLRMLTDPDIAGAAWKGLSGQSKKTYSDVFAEGGAENDDLGEGIRNFAADVLLDPTTYIGAGTIKAGLGGLKKLGTVGRKSSEAVRFSDDGETIVRMPQATTRQLESAPVRTSDKDFSAFVRDVTRNKENPGAPSIFDNVIDQQGNPVRTAIPDFARQFTVGPEGAATTSERFMLPGPTPDVISTRANLDSLDEIAKQVPQFQYGRWIDEIPETGFFREEITRVDIPQSRVQMDQAAVREKYSFLADKFNDEDLANIKNPTVRLIMSRTDEPVFARYEPKDISYTGEKGKEIKGKIWAPNPEDLKDGNWMYMGELRAQLRDPKITPQKRQRLQSMLVNHIRAVDDYAKSGPAGYKGEAGKQAFYQEMYGARPKDLAKQMPKGIKPGPFQEAAPTYYEVSAMRSMEPHEKLAKLEEWRQMGLEPVHATYLSQASNAKSFATRLKHLQMLARGGSKEGDFLSRGAEDVIEGIRAGRIQSFEEPGIGALLKRYKIEVPKSLTAKKEADLLERLAKAMDKDVQATRKAEQKMLGKIPKEQPVTKESIPAPPTKELGPTGKTYLPFEAKIEKQVKAAKAKAASGKKAPQIVEEVLNGDKSALTAPKVSLDATQSQVFSKALQIAVDHEIIGPNDKELWKFVTRTGVRRTKKTPNKGRGRVQDAWNKFSQYTFLKALLTDIKSIDSQVKSALDDMGTKGGDRLAARGDYIYNLLMEPMRGMDEILKQGGVFPVLGTRKSDTPLSLYQILESLDPLFVKQNIFTMRTVNTHAGKETLPLFPVTQLMDAIDVGLAGLKSDMTERDLLSLIHDTLAEQKFTRGGKRIPNRYNYVSAGFEDVGDMEDMLSPIIDALPRMAQQVEANMAARKLWHENQVFEGTQAALDEIAARVVAPDANIAELLKLSNDVDDVVLKGVTRSKGLDPDDAWMVKQEVTAALPQFDMPPQVRAAGKRAKVNASAKTRAERVALDVDAMAESTRAVEELGIPLHEVATKYEHSLTHRFINAIFPHYGNEQIRKFFLDNKSATQTMARTYQGMIGSIAKKHTKDNIALAWRELQNGTWSTDPNVIEAQRDINKAIGVMFSDDRTYSFYHRNNMDARELNAHFKHYKIHEKYHFTDDTMHNAWRDWDTNDPLNLLAVVNAASMRSLGKKLLGDQLMLEFGSKVKKPGYVKIQNKGNEILRHVDTDTYFFPQEIAKEMYILDRFLRIDMKPTYAGQGADLLRFYDSALHRWKSGLTIYRPGHHARNMVGDVWLSFMAGVNNPSVYMDAAKVMARMKSRYKDFDAVKALAVGDNFDARVSNDSTVAFTKVGGKRVSLKASDIYRGLYDRGLLPDYRTLDDLQIGSEKPANFFEKLGISTESKPAQFFSQGPFGGKLHQTAASFSEARDHYIRLAHAIDVLKKGNFKSLDEAYTQAAHTVRKWHPDGSDLSHFEAKVMRRIIPFYSWLRKAIPLVVEGMAMQPGKAMMYPKFMYNMAEANGIDLDSLSNPFPTDQMFPDWISESLQGPLFEDNETGYWGIQPGVPMMDILGDYGGNAPDRQIMGSLTPFAKIPMEMAYGPEGAVARDVRTDVPYFDTSDYIDKQIPNANLAIGLTGMSPTSGFTQPKGGAEREAQPDAQRTLLNFLTGLGLVNMSKPGYIQQAKREETQRERNR